MIQFNQKLDESLSYFITSDLHFFHKNILKFNAATRPYRDIEHMHEVFITHWNETVGEEDYIFHLGDFSFAGKDRTQELIERLNGNIVWVLGNHDYKVFSNLSYPTHHYLQVRYKGHLICMSHYPIGSWNQQSRGSLHFHGHSHSNYKGTAGRMLDIGWDNVGKILSLDEAIDRVKDIEIYHPDRHRELGGKLYGNFKILKQLIRKWIK